MSGPTVKIVSTKGDVAQYVDWAKRQFEQQSTALKNHYLPDCIIQCNKANNSILILDLSKTGIVCHPRTAASAIPSLAGSGYKLVIPGGWENGITEITTGNVFPLFDADNASFLTDNNGSEFLGDVGNYGNTYWHNADFSTIISYKTPPVKHQAMAEESVFGYDFCVFEFGGYFGYQIYSGGEVLETSPINPYTSSFFGIRGAALVDNILLIATKQYLYKKNLNTNTAWELLYEIPYAQEWQFSLDGTKLISGIGTLITLDANNAYAVSSLTDLSESTRSTNISNYNAMQFSGNSKLFFELSRSTDTVLHNTICYTGAFNSDIDTDSGITYSDIKLFMKYPPTDVRIEVPSDSGGCLVITAYRADGAAIDYPTKCAPMEITVDGPVYESPVGSGCWKLNTTCNYQELNTITATVTGAHDSFSVTGSIEVTLPAHPGWWEEVSCEFTYISRLGSNCITMDTSQGFCDAYDYSASTTPSSIIENNTKRILWDTYPYGGTIDRTVWGASPSVPQCDICNYTLGAMGGVVVSSTSSTYTVGVTTGYVGAPDGILCGGPYPNLFPVVTKTTISLNKVPFKTYKWVCA